MIEKADFWQIIGMQTIFLSALIGAVWRSVNTKIDAVEQRLNQKIDDVEVRLNQKIDDVEKKLNKRIDDVERNLNGRMDRFEMRLIDIDQRLCRLEGSFASKDFCGLRQQKDLGDAG